jgi:hypothetical protein
MDRSLFTDQQWLESESAIHRILVKAPCTFALSFSFKSGDGGVGDEVRFDTNDDAVK